MYRHKSWKPSKAQKEAFKQTMSEIETFVETHHIEHSSSYDSFYFTVNGKRYRVSNHSIEASNRAAYDELGNQKRELYHDWERDKDTVYIHASKTRLIQIYTDLEAGRKLNGCGVVIE